MDKKSASLILESILSLSPRFDELIQLISKLPQGPERDAMREAVGELFDVTTSCFVVPIVTQYPELDPDR